MAYMRTGLGGYQRVPENWSWLYYPPPYAFADPLGITPPPNFYAPPEEMGMAGCGCGGSCGGCNGLGDNASGSPAGLDTPTVLLLIAGGILVYALSNVKRPPEIVSGPRKKTRKRRR